MGSYLEYEALVVTTSSSGYVTTYSTKAFNGFVQLVRIVPATNSTEAYSTGGNIALLAEVGGHTILTVDDPSSTGLASPYSPVYATVSSTGAASTGSVRPPLRNERIQIVITSGSTTNVGTNSTFHFYIG